MTPDRPGSGFSLRCAVPGDAGALAGLEALAFATDRIGAEEYGELIAAETVEVWVAERSGEPVGVVVTRHAPSADGEAYVYSLAVHPDHRGLGIGSALLKVALLGAHRRAAGSIRLEVRPDNRSARTLYRTIGFVPNGRVENWYEDGAPALCMRMELRGAA